MAKKQLMKKLEGADDAQRSKIQRRISFMDKQRSTPNSQESSRQASASMSQKSPMIGMPRGGMSQPQPQLPEGVDQSTLRPSVPSYLNLGPDHPAFGDIAKAFENGFNPQPKSFLQQTNQNMKDQASGQFANRQPQPKVQKQPELQMPAPQPMQMPSFEGMSWEEVMAKLQQNGSTPYPQVFGAKNG